jgi:hypothetical protein
MVSKSQRKRVQAQSLKKRQANALAKSGKEIVVPVMRSVTYRDQPLNDLHDELQMTLNKVRKVSEQLDGFKPEMNVVSALMVGFSGLAGYAGDNDVSLFDFLRVVEQQANLMITEARALSALGNETVN